MGNEGVCGVMELIRYAVGMRLLYFCQKIAAGLYYVVRSKYRREGD